MHPEVGNFVKSVKDRYPSSFSGKKVLEVGSLDINGSVRGFFQGCDYIGLDVGPGPGVDVVCPIHKYVHPEEFDVIISTEMLEHDKFWEASLSRMYKDLKSGGILIFTCAGPTRQEHGTTRTTPTDAPFTTDYYRNITIEDFTSILPPSLFTVFHICYERGQADLYAYGVKR